MSLGEFVNTTITHGVEQELRVLRDQYLQLTEQISVGGSKCHQSRCSNTLCVGCACQQYRFLMSCFQASIIKQLYDCILLLHSATKPRIGTATDPHYHNDSARDTAGTKYTLIFSANLVLY